MRMVLVVVATFLLCWSLYFVLMVLRKREVHVSCDVLYLRLLLAHFNSALTPWLYAMFSENFRQGFGDILSKLGCPVLFARYSNSVKCTSTTSGRQNSAVDNFQPSFELKTLGTPHTGSTVQLLDWPSNRHISTIFFSDWTFYCMWSRNAFFLGQYNYVSLRSIMSRQSLFPLKSWPQMLITADSELKSCRTFP